jgi:sigma-B regulation protein RsbU (phosphoserine phosphatase)
LISDGNLNWLDAAGVHFPLGMKEDSVYTERSVQLRSGDVVCFLTDGITEAMNASLEQFSQERIEHIMRTMDLRQLSARQILDRVTDEVRRHVGDAAQHDDMTMVVVKVGAV